MNGKKRKKSTDRNGSPDRRENFPTRVLQFLAFLLLAVAALVDLGTLMIQKLWLFKRKAT